MFYSNQNVPNLFGFNTSNDREQIKVGDIVYFIDDLDGILYECEVWKIHDDSVTVHPVRNDERSVILTPLTLKISELL